MALAGLAIFASGGPAARRLAAQGEPASSASASPLVPPTAHDPVFKIGFLLAGSDLSSPDPAETRRLMDNLRAALMARPEIVEALARAGFREVSPRACAEPFDMAQRLRAQEFELAFATAVIYARLFIPRPGEPDEFQAVTYEPILQTRASSDVAAGHSVYRQGALFVGPSSPLWAGQPTDEAIRAELARSPLALADAYSAAAHVYPILKVSEKFPGLTLPSPIFCRSSAEVLKHVVSGLAGVGACETRLLEGPLGVAVAPGGSRKPLVRELLRLNPIPTDPVLLRGDLAPHNGRGDSATELRGALQDFFNGLAGRYPGVKLDRAERRAYEAAARALARFDQIAPGTFLPAGAAEPDGASEPGAREKFSAASPAP